MRSKSTDGIPFWPCTRMPPRTGAGVAALAPSVVRPVAAKDRVRDGGPTCQDARAASCTVIPPFLLWAARVAPDIPILGKLLDRRVGLGARVALAAVGELGELTRSAVRAGYEQTQCRWQTRTPAGDTGGSWSSAANSPL